MNFGLKIIIRAIHRNGFERLNTWSIYQRFDYALGQNLVFENPV